MIASMTGFGRADAEENGRRVLVEIKSVNGRYADVSVHLPRSLAELEPRIKEVILQSLTRGHITAVVSLQGENGERGIPVLNEAVLRAYEKGLARARAIVGEAEPLHLHQLATLPSVFDFESEKPDPVEAWNVVEPACRSAVDQCLEMRLSEGRKLEKDMVERVEILNRLVTKVESLAPSRAQAVRERLEEKLNDLLAPGQIDENRLLMEITLLSERTDVTEETVRFQSHNNQFLQTLKRDEAVGRRLNFLLQEMLREANTIGSKSGDSEISHLVVEMKEEIERLKEQVQNIE